MCCYFTSMRPGHYRIYASRDSSFWCCGHTGLESPAKLGKFIYSHKVTNRHQEKDIRVNLFIPSILSWKEEGVELIQQSRIPESEQVDLTLNLKKKQKLILRIRKPDWTDKATFIINGEEEQPLLGISFDMDKEQWKDAIKRDTLDWEQVCDFGGLNSEIAKQYSIKQIPANILLSADGKILAKNLTGEELKKKIEEVVSAAEEKEKQNNKKKK